MWVIPRKLSESFPCAQGAAGSKSASARRSAALYSFWSLWRGRRSQRSTWRLRLRLPWLRRLSGRIWDGRHEDFSRAYDEWLEDVSSRLLPVSPASRTAQPASESTSTTSAGSGRGSLHGFARYDLGSSSWRMCQGSLFKDSNPSPRPWPKAGMLLVGVAFELPKREPHNGENGSSWSEFYPTPSATSYGSSQNEGKVPHDRPSRGTPSRETWAKQWPTPKVRMGDTGPSGLRRNTPGIEAKAVEFFRRFRQALGTGPDGSECSRPADGTCSPRSPGTSGDWPTPTTIDHRATKPGVVEGKGSRLRSTAAEWPTPTVSSSSGNAQTATNPTPGQTGGTTLAGAAREWATPTAGDAKLGQGLTAGTTEKGGRSLAKDAGTFIPGEKRRLNVRFTAWLMGWLSDTELTVSGCLATGSCPSKPRSPSES